MPSSIINRRALVVMVSHWAEGNREGPPRAALSMPSFTAHRAKDDALLLRRIQVP
jgi:hypothetical protein